MLRTGELGRSRETRGRARVARDGKWNYLKGRIDRIADGLDGV